MKETNGEGSGALWNNDGLREEIVASQQVKADSALADIEGPVLDIGVALQELFEVVDDLARGIDDRGALRQGQIDEEFGAIRAGKELLLHELPARERRRGDRIAAEVVGERMKLEPYRVGGGLSRLGSLTCRPSPSE